MDGERLLLTEVGCRYRNLFLHRLAADGVYPTTVLEFASVEAIKQCVIARMGITVLPKMAVERELTSGQLTALPWIDTEFHVMNQMLWHKEKWVSPALQAFLAMARASFTMKKMPTSNIIPPCCWRLASFSYHLATPTGNPSTRAG